MITNVPKRQKSKFSLSQQVDGWMLSKITEKIIRENAFEQKKKKPGLNDRNGHHFKGENCYSSFRLVESTARMIMLNIHISHCYLSCYNLSVCVTDLHGVYNFARVSGHKGEKVCWYVS